MTTIQFYHLLTTPLERALPKLLEKAVAGGFKTLLLAESDERVEQFNQLLWTYDPNSFLPHGSLKDGSPEQQPILISSRIEPQNHANLLAVTDGTLAEKPEQFERVLDILNGNDPGAVEKARARWKTYKDQGNSLGYYQQTDQGGWQQKAVG